MAQHTSVDPTKRIQELTHLYGARDVSVAALLCDGHNPHAIAYRVIDEDLSSVDVTYGELREKSERLAAGFRSLGVKPGDRVATLMGKSVEYLVTLLAIWRLGAVHVPLFTAFAAPAVAVRLKGSAAKLVVSDGRQLSKLAQTEK
ncbi:MAG: AMP-binding protein, partial [Alphaproteobacteria bacterium]|nr:AMP-binding protein [Alphaproteobacteria bacterium]